jgi:hypothetical protein
MLGFLFLEEKIMNLKHLSDEKLHSETLKTAQEERDALTKMLHHLKEIDRRRYFSKLKYPSLFEYTVNELKYSEAQAVRRISTMRLMRDLPEIEEKIETGTLTLTNINLVQQMFSKEKKAGKTFSNSEKAQILMSFENQSTRQAEKIAAEISLLMKKKTGIELHMIEDDALREKLTQLGGRYAHSDPHISLEQLLHKICDEVLVEDKRSKAKTKSNLPSAPKVKANVVVTPRKNTAEIYRQVWQRDNHKCTNCRSTYAIEVDHIVPRAVGGESTLENLRLLCRSCNQRAAVEHFGVGKMEKFLVRETS